MQWQAGGGRPEFELVAMTVTPMTTVAAHCQVDGEGHSTGLSTCRQRAMAVPLLATTTLWLEAEQLENLVDWDFCAQVIEVDAGHG